MSVALAKQALKTYCDASRSPMEGGAPAARDFFAPGAQINLVHPFNELNGANEYVTRFLTPLTHSFAHLRRAAYIAFGGTFEDGAWVTCTGYYSGHFAEPWLGIAPTGALSHLRFGEFHRVEDGRAVQSYIFLDIPELMIAAGQWPVTDFPGRDRGFTGYLPGPQTQDGLLWGDVASARGEDSCRMVTDMLRKLATEDEAWRPYWHNGMIWYGPAAFGSFVGVENFAGFQVPFEDAFEGWSGGAANNGITAHFTRFGDGDYVCSGGWPSLTGVQVKPFLGQPARGERLYMRVCDWWRREDDLLVENWVFVDIPHVLAQMGNDLFAGGQLHG